MTMLSRCSEVLLTRANKRLSRAHLPAGTVLYIHTSLLSESRADYGMIAFRGWHTKQPNSQPQARRQQV